MSELLASILGAGLVFGLAVPLATLAAKVILMARWRRDPDPRRHGSLLTFLLLVLPSLGAIVWFVSAALHISEPGGSHGVCTLDHAGATACVDALLFALLLSGLMATALTRGWWRIASRVGNHGRRLAPTAPETLRLDRICEAHPRLRDLRPRIFVLEGSEHGICTRGLLRPVIEVDGSLLSRLNDSAVTAALLHEAEHYGDRDPLRYLVASVSVALNPCGFMLRRELLRWRAAREVVCDEWAVRRLADPLSLAEALVAVARLDHPARAFAAGLGGPDSGLLRLRVHLLLDYASRPPGRPSIAPAWFGLGAALGVLTLPHFLGAWPLDLAHLAVERALAALGLI
ncbi:MAG: hypothetical protein H6706_14330 [Myxococcales bacterium]|nr:hypothetical protein [Myxococcales bacterium]